MAIESRLQRANRICEALEAVTDKVTADHVSPGRMIEVRIYEPMGSLLMTLGFNDDVKEAAAVSALKAMLKHLGIEGSYS